jgi:site-specific DNA recombinase
VIRDILSCEKYIGDAALQKKYVNNHIEKKLVKNNGELPMYYAEGTHEPIIDRSTFEMAQDILRRWDEKTKGHSPHKHYPFSGKIVCGSCGLSYKHITTNS